MNAVTLRAHLDGKQICLDEPFEIPPDAKLFVTVVPATDDTSDLRDWYEFGKRSLARAYDDDEPDYSNAVILERPSE
ncbi:MAG: hypothetical protein DME26_09115 [Verrucomicrobia bacterium]|nr:MAG: hypothetical protein DME26_09115 [Verrucomicrobiota bacterium]